MKQTLKILFALFWLGILYGTLTASLDQGVLAALKKLWPDPWFRATLMDTYFAFTTIYLWIAYKEKMILGKIVWFFLIMIFGTFAFSTYILIQLFKLKKEDTLSKLLLKSES